MKEIKANFDRGACKYLAVRQEVIDYIELINHSNQHGEEDSIITIGYKDRKQVFVFNKKTAEEIFDDLISEPQLADEQSDANKQ